MTESSLLHGHVERFNEGVRSGDFSPMLGHFTEDASLEFVGVPVGPFEGKPAIARAYREQPPDDEIDLLDVAEVNGEIIVAPYAWRRDTGQKAGELRLSVRDGLIARLVVTFE